MAGSDASEGQAVWQPGGAEEDSRLREGNRHVHLAYDEEEEDRQKQENVRQKTRNRLHAEWKGQNTSGIRTK